MRRAVVFGTEVEARAVVAQIDAQRGPTEVLTYDGRQVVAPRLTWAIPFRVAAGWAVPWKARLRSIDPVLDLERRAVDVAELELEPAAKEG